ncbi:hypothetical protein EVAR_55435_1 [Eumeta japonica]|uniref:Uncharacterized protein n=1 Tax=Eumeta variegata TaxID=151549 RepID=A0A4C1Y2I2_EUMVA|nr:hypothetical protein EVAR_55435_1 [Eumeta japonica]
MLTTVTTFVSRLRPALDRRGGLNVPAQQSDVGVLPRQWGASTGFVLATHRTPLEREQFKNIENGLTLVLPIGTSGDNGMLSFVTLGSHKLSLCEKSHRFFTPLPRRRRTNRQTRSHISLETKRAGTSPPPYDCGREGITLFSDYDIRSGPRRRRPALAPVCVRARVRRGGDADRYEPLYREETKDKKLYMNAFYFTLSQPKPYVNVNYPPYSLDLVRSDCFLFLDLKMDLLGNLDANDEASKVVMTESFGKQNENHFCKGSNLHANPTNVVLAAGHRCANFNTIVYGVDGGFGSVVTANKVYGFGSYESNRGLVVKIVVGKPEGSAVSILITGELT